MPGFTFLEGRSGRLLSMDGVYDERAAFLNVGFIPQNNRIAIDGNSIAQYEWSATAIQKNCGIGFWAGFLSGARVLFPQNRDYGVAGETSAQILARINATIASAADCAAIVIAPLDTNDRGVADVPYATSIANITAYVTAMRDAGKYMFYVLNFPRYNTLMTATQRLINQRVRDWCKATLPTIAPGRISLIDAYSDLVDQDSTTQDIRAAIALDGTHPGPAMYYIGKRVSDEINRLYPAIDRFAGSGFAAYDATNNPRGNLVVNGGMRGNGGTLFVGAGTKSGTWANSWGVNTPGSTTAVYTAQQKRVGNTYDNQTLQQIATSGTIASSGTAFDLYQVLTGVVAGDVLQAFAYAEWDAGMSGIQGIGFRLRLGASGITVSATGDAIGGVASPIAGGGAQGQYMPQEACAGVFALPAMTVPDLTSTDLRISTYGTAFAATAFNLPGLRVGPVIVQRA